MKRLGIKVTEEELQRVLTALRASGMWMSGGTPLGDPGFEVAQLSKKYNLPQNTGLDTVNGEFISPE